MGQFAAFWTFAHGHNLAGADTCEEIGDLIELATQILCGASPLAILAFAQAVIVVFHRYSILSSMVSAARFSNRVRPFLS
jgi:hypothetical protein